MPEHDPYREVGMDQPHMRETLAPRPTPPRVFIVQDTGRFDFAPAKRFGELVYLVRRDAFPDDAEARMRVVGRIMRKLLEDFRAGQDYLLMTGDPLAIAQAVLTLAYYSVQSIQCLKWDRESADYFAVRVEAA